MSLLILTSCGGRSAEEDAKAITDSDDIVEAMREAMEAKGTKQIALYEAVALDLQNLIDIIDYYIEDEDAFDAFWTRIKGI